MLQNGGKKNGDSINQNKMAINPKPVDSFRKMASKCRFEAE